MNMLYVQFFMWFLRIKNNKYLRNCAKKSRKYVQNILDSLSLSPLQKVIICHKDTKNTKFNEM